METQWTDERDLLPVYWAHGDLNHFPLHFWSGVLVWNGSSI